MVTAMFVCTSYSSTSPHDFLEGPSLLYFNHLGILYTQLLIIITYPYKSFTYTEPSSLTSQAFCNQANTFSGIFPIVAMANNINSTTPELRSYTHATSGCVLATLIPNPEIPCFLWLLRESPNTPSRIRFLPSTGHLAA